MRLVQDDEAVGSGHGGIDRTHRPRRSIAAKEQPRPVHGKGGQHHRRPGRVRRPARCDAAAKPDHFQRVSGRIGRQRAQAVSDRCHDLGRPANESLRRGIAERFADRFGVCAGRIDQQTPVDDPPDTGRRGSVCRRTVCLRRKPPDGNVQTSGLAKAGRHADFDRPFLGISDLRRQTRLPGERIAPVDRSIEPSETRHWGQDWPIRRPGLHHRAGSLSASSSTGTQRPNPRCRPAPITTGP